MRLNVSPNRQREILALLLILIGGLTLLALFGVTGAYTAIWVSVLTRFCGWGAYLLAATLVVAGISMLRRGENVYDEFPIPWARIVGLEILFVAIVALIHLAVAADDREALQLAENGQGGGYLGLAVSSLFLTFFGKFLDSTFATALTAIVLVVICLLTIRFAFSFGRVSAFLTRTLEALRPSPVPATGVAPRAAAVETASKLPSNRSLVQLPLSDAEKKPYAPTATAAQKRPASEVMPPPVQPPPKPKTETPMAVAEPEVEKAPRIPLFGFALAAKEKSSQSKAKAAPPEPTYDPLLAVPIEKAKLRADHLPNVELLEVSSEAKYAQATAQDKAHTIEQTLEQFGIPAKVIDINAGPTITQFAVEPGFIERRGLDGQLRQRKVPVSRIQSLSNDLALALAASPIRIEAPVPGRSYVGIEVPNESISLVSLRGVMESDAYKKLSEKASLPFALGRDVSGAPAAADLGTMPHLLIAGATGSGKSVAINAIIACLLFSHSPDELRMVMVDPKRVELVNYNGIPHLLGEVITDVALVVPALRWATQLMDARFQAFSKAATRNIEAYNAKMTKDGGDRLPYVVILIDELADLMLAAPDETEKLITRLAQMARATGIHLILATQRPSVDVVTGLIKANFPARISFAVTSSVDSRVVLDTPGAEKLLGRGDMLYMAPDSAKLSRLQGCFVSDIELGRLTDHWRKLQEEFDYIPKAPWEVKSAPEKQEKAGDELMDDAIEVIRKNNAASISMLQRKLGIGYPRAARLIDQLEEQGVVGPDEGNGKPRAIYLPETGKKKK